MSTSHYSNGNYKPIKSSNPNPALISPSRTDDFPEPGMREMREAVYAWEDSLSHPSLAHSRPEAGDVGSETIRFNIRHKSQLPRLTALLFAGIMLLLADGAAIAYYADSVVEATIIALATMPTGGFIIATALAIRHQD